MKDFAQDAGHDEGQRVDDDLRIGKRSLDRERDAEHALASRTGEQRAYDRDRRDAGIHARQRHVRAPELKTLGLVVDLAADGRTN